MASDTTFPFLNSSDPVEDISNLFDRPEGLKWKLCRWCEVSESHFDGYCVNCFYTVTQLWQIFSHLEENRFDFYDDPLQTRLHYFVPTDGKTYHDSDFFSLYRYMILFYAETMLRIKTFLENRHTYRFGTMRQHLDMLLFCLHLRNTDFSLRHDRQRIKDACCELYDFIKEKHCFAVHDSMHLDYKSVLNAHAVLVSRVFCVENNRNLAHLIESSRKTMERVENGMMRNALVKFVKLQLPGRKLTYAPFRLERRIRSIVRRAKGENELRVMVGEYAKWVGLIEVLTEKDKSETMPYLEELIKKGPGRIKKLENSVSNQRPQFEKINYFPPMVNIFGEKNIADKPFDFN